jgi:uncharacterized protein YqgC (DUF456 family)
MKKDTASLFYLLSKVTTSKLGKTGLIVGAITGLLVSCGALQYPLFSLGVIVGYMFGVLFIRWIDWMRWQI